MTASAPQITVLMTVFNASPFLRVAIDSILDQTYTNFNFLIVDDASTDDSCEIVRSYTDERIELLRLEQNIGQTAALNAGLLHALTPWIARMDADDFSAPNRFEEQMNVLDADPSITCLGTYAWFFHDDAANVQGEVITPLNHADICSVVVGSPIVHGSMMVRREAMLDVGLYNDKYRVIADIELYDRLLPKYTAANLDIQLLGVRQHVGQMSNSIRASDEIIELFSRKLASQTYSPKDAATVRVTLCKAYLFKAKNQAKNLKPIQFASNFLYAFKVSPRSFVWNTFMVFVANNLSQRTRRLIKRSFKSLSAPLKKAS